MINENEPCNDETKNLVQVKCESAECVTAVSSLRWVISKRKLWNSDKIQIRNMTMFELFLKPFASAISHPSSNLYTGSKFIFASITKFTLFLSPTNSTSI